MSDFASAVIKSMAIHSRKDADFYPTPVDATYSLAAIMAQVFEPGARILEPACGDGRLSRVLEWCGYDVLSTDLIYRGYGQGGIDFLGDHDYGDVDGVFTNPPFKLSVEFIEKALSLSPNVFMFVKQNYWNVISRFDLFHTKRPALFLPLTWRPAFLKKERGNSPLMDCGWCIWLDDDVWESFGICAFEPLKKSVYPGYHDIGFVGAMAQLGIEIEVTTMMVQEMRRWLQEHPKENSRQSAENLHKIMVSYSGMSKEKESMESLIPFVERLVAA
ncbi:hypothetical protein [uncultured Sulfitobacter sp.]|uniref:hypothetical protein n=1 Tax=uncultured Sulfitobacter sp. TaxID=191468 RepID=UPI002593C9C1|nr:hypothetical protein [uncultured Sulfitobacter sp.]